MMKIADCKKLILIALIPFLGCKDDEPEIPSGDLEGIFEKVWTDFDQTYSYFEIKGMDWDSVYNANRPTIINGKTSVEELANILAEMTVSLKDLHVSFTAGSITHQYQNGNFNANSPENATNYLSTISTNTNSLIIGGIENTNILYVRIKNLSSNGDFQPLETVISELPGKDGLILDLRDNGGGNDEIARAFVDGITKVERVYELVRYRNGPGRNDFGDWIEAKVTPADPVHFVNPIVVLINRGVVSSAESFVNMMTTLPNTLLVGDTTRGSSGNPKGFMLSNGWRYEISSWQVVTPDLSFIEDQGIAPNFVITNSEESMNDGLDLILEKAIELLQ